MARKVMWAETAWRDLEEIGDIKEVNKKKTSKANAEDAKPKIAAAGGV